MSDEATQHLKVALEAAHWTAARNSEIGRTPERFLELLERFGAPRELAPLSTFETDSTDLVAATEISFRSLCVHHIMPFFGYIDIVYQPAGKACGFGGLLRAVEHFSHQPQLQEKLVDDLAAHLYEALGCAGVLVRCRARQMCVEMRRTDARPIFVTSRALGTLAGDGGTLARHMLAQHEPAP